jgi:hypothetical protein
VVDKALNYVFARDREFQEYLKSPLAAKAVPSLRVRRAGAADVPESVGSGKRSRGGVENVVSSWKRHPWYSKSPVRCEFSASLRDAIGVRLLSSIIR